MATEFESKYNEIKLQMNEMQNQNSQISVEK